MANKNITTSKNNFLEEINGVTYFKLISNYPPDKTKNCSLLSSEVDANFYFLRGYDIKSVSVEDGFIVLTRLNGDKLRAQLPNDAFTLAYDSENGVLTVTFADGSQQSVDGFLVEKDLEDAVKKVIGKTVKVSTDSTINGDGRITNPLRLSEVERTGTYAPAKELYDITEDDNKMPETDKDGNKFPKGYRIVTKEMFTKFGRLYTRREVENIAEALSGTNSSSMWHIPSKCEWDGLLVAAECDDYAKFGVVNPDCDWDSMVNPGICPMPNVKHCTTEINVWTGKDAGARAKSVLGWEDSDREEDYNSVQGEDNIPSDAGSSTQTFHVIPIGYAEGSRGVISKDEDYDIEGVTKVASFWTNTPVVSNINGCYARPNYYTRTFAFDTRKVLQESSKPESRLSLRLVKNYDYDNMQYNEYETILGHNVPCVLVTDERTDYAQVWTSINVGFSEFGGVESDDWSEALSGETANGVYFINEWDGKKWLKKLMNEGDSVVLINAEDESGNTIYNHEWRVFVNDEGEMELVDTADAIKGEFQEEIDALNDRVDAIEDRMDDLEDGLDDLWEALSAETVDRMEEDAVLDEKIQNEADERKAVDDELWDALSAETAERMADVENLQVEIEQVESALTEETADREEADEFLQEQIDELKDLEQQDIADSGHTIESVIDMSDDENNKINLVLKRKSGEEIPINGKVEFNANFGLLP